MHEVIARVIAVEAEARGIVADAQAEAERILHEAQEAARSRTEQSLKDAQDEAAHLLATALREAQDDKAARLAEVAREIEAGVRMDPSTRQALVDAIVRCVAGVR